MWVVATETNRFALFGNGSEDNSLDCTVNLKILLFGSFAIFGTNYAVTKKVYFFTPREIKLSYPYSVMELTENIKGVIRAAMRDKKVTQVELAAHLGLSHVWVSKMLRSHDKNGLKSLSDEQVDKIEEKLGIELYVLVDNRRHVSGTAIRLSELGESMPEVARVMDALVALGETKSLVFQPSHFETEEMVALGREITRLVITHGNKPGKIAWDTLSLVSKAREASPASTENRVDALEKSITAKPRSTKGKAAHPRPAASKNR